MLFIIGWGYRWLRARDPLYVEPALSHAQCPIVRQLLGATSSQAGLVRPCGADTPLQEWLLAHNFVSTASGGQGRGHPANRRWSEVGKGSPVAAVAERMRLGDIGGHSTRPHHPGRARLLAEPPSNPLQAGRRKGVYPTIRAEDERQLQHNPHVVAAPDEPTTVALVQLNPDTWRRNALGLEQSQRFDANGFLILNHGRQVLNEPQIGVLQERASQHFDGTHDNARSATFLFCASSEPPPEAVSRLLANEAASVCAWFVAQPQYHMFARVFASRAATADAST